MRRPVAHAALAVALFATTGCDVPHDDERAAHMRSDRSPHQAVLRGDARALLRHYQEGSDLNALNKDGLTPLLIAIATGRDALARQLIEWGVDISLADAEGSTPLHLAADRYATDLVRLLIEHNAAVDARDTAGRTPAERAHAMHHTDMVAQLIAAGASPPTVATVQEREPAPSTAATTDQPPLKRVYREWTSAAREQTRAEFIELLDDVVVLRTPNDRMIHVPLDHLRPEDRQLAHTLQRSTATSAK